MAAMVRAGESAGGAQGLASHEPLDVERLIDDTPISPQQWTVGALCSVLCMADGFDIQAMAFAAPQISRDWGVPLAAFGPIFSAGVFGGLIGGFFISPLGDKIGSKRIVVASILLFGVATLATAMASSLNALFACRAVAAVGMGSVLPAIIAILAAVMPRRLRATGVVFGSCSIVIGAIIGGTVSAKTMETYGWQSVFVMGGCAPLLCIPLVLRMLQNPLSFLLAKGSSADTIMQALNRLGKRQYVGAATQFSMAIPQAQRTTLRAMVHGREWGTALLMLFASISAIFYFNLSSWLPSILKGNGSTLRNAVLGGVLFNAGGLIGCITWSFLINRYGPYRIMAPCYLLGSVLLIPMAAGANGAPLFALIFLTGLFGLGGHLCQPALTTSFYPAQFHSTGVGLTMGFTRIGGSIGPLLGGFILGAGANPASVFGFASVTAAASAFTIWAMYLVIKGRRERVE